MTEQHVNSGGKAGFLGGSLVSVFMSISSSDIIETVFYAALGTVISFLVSLLLKKLFRRYLTRAKG
ncbi:MAG: hypothetical protein JEZ14_16100 [Marinilabiliaceae bacterium]|nr:hypothetical protein [Marinilabiliaceae bacterium]